MNFRPEISSASVVVVGDFAPSLFHPAWFLAKGIITPAEADEAQLQITSPEVSSFSTSVVSFYADRQRVSVTAPKEPIVNAFDYSLNLLGVFPDQPISKLGINRDVHIRLHSLDAWHSLGNILAPKAPWGPKALRDGKPWAGMRSLTMEWPRSGPQTAPGFTHLRVEPSLQLGNGGVFFGMNDHYELDERGRSASAEKAIDTIRANWQLAVEFADGIIQNLVGQIA